MLASIWGYVEIGRQDGLKNRCRNAYGFESHYPYHKNILERYLKMNNIINIIEENISIYESRLTEAALDGSVDMCMYWSGAVAALKLTADIMKIGDMNNEELIDNLKKSYRDAVATAATHKKDTEEYFNGIAGSYCVVIHMLGGTFKH